MIGLTLQTIGTLLVGAVALRVHHRVIARQTVDENVLRIMKREQQFGALGLVLIVLGYAAQVLFRS